MYVNFTDYSGTFHDSMFSHSTGRKVDDTENGPWFDGIKSEVLAKGVLEFIGRSRKEERLYLFLRCRDCEPVKPTVL
jgi:hypothetical protein